jgi:hypothetical protein
MKTKISILLIATAFTLNGFSQAPKNVKSETTTVITTIKDSEGEKKLVKTEETREVQKIELGQESPNTINIPQVNSPVNVTTTTQLSVDGEIKSVDVDRSAYYVFNGEKYEFKSDKQGYTLNSVSSKNRAILRKTSNNNYIYINKNKVAVGYYDSDGNFILETYDSTTESMKKEKFEKIK